MIYKINNGIGVYESGPTFDHIMGDVSPLLIQMAFGFLPGLIAYLALRKRYALKPCVFWYSIGFTGCLFMFLIGLLGLGLVRDAPQPTESDELIVWLVCCAVSYPLIYYSYAALLHGKERRIDKTTLCLVAGIAVLLTTGFIIESANDMIPASGFILLAYVACMTLCMKFDFFGISLRLMAWSMFLPAHIVFLFSLLMSGPII